MVAITDSDVGSGADGIVNLVPNPGFETDTSTWTTNSTFWTNSGATLTRITSDFDSGVACAKVVTDAISNQEGLVCSSLPTLLANTSYTFSARVKWISGRPVRFGFRDGTNASNNQTGYSSPTQWTTFTFTYTTGSSPVTGSSLAVATDTTAAVSEFHVDTVFVYLTSEIEKVNIRDGVPETSSGADAGEKISLADTDVGVGIESSSISTSLSSADTGQGLESSALNIISSDIGTGIDTSSVPSATLSDSDSVVGTDTAIVNHTDSDSASGSETFTNIRTVVFITVSPLSSSDQWAYWS